MGNERPTEQLYNRCGGLIAVGRGAVRTSGGNDVPGGYHVDNAQNYYAWTRAPLNQPTHSYIPATGTVTE